MASSSSFCLRAPLTYHAVRPDPRTGTRMGGHGQEGCTTLPRLFLSSTCGLSPSNGSPPPSSFMVSPEKLHFCRAGSSWPWSNSGAIYKSDQCPFQESLSFDVSDTTTEPALINVLQDGSWLPRLAMPSCAFRRNLRLASPWNTAQRREGVTGTSGSRPPACHLCGKLHRTCIADIGWCLTFVSAPPIGYDPRAEDLRKHVPPAHHGTPVRAIVRTTSRLSHRLCVSPAAYRAVALIRGPVAHCGAWW